MSNPHADDRPGAPKSGRNWLADFWTLLVAGGLILALLAIYIAHFNNGFSTSSSEWGDLGDYLGGVVGPLIGFLTVLLLIQTKRLQQDELRDTLDELKRSTDALVRQGDLLEKQTSLISAQTDLALAQADAIHDPRFISQDWRRVPMQEGPNVVLRRIISLRNVGAPVVDVGIESLTQTVVRLYPDECPYLPAEDIINVVFDVDPSPDIPIQFNVVFTRLDGKRRLHSMLSNNGGQSFFTAIIGPHPV